VRRRVHDGQSEDERARERVRSRVPRRAAEGEDKREGPLDSRVRGGNGPPARVRIQCCLRVLVAFEQVRGVEGEDRAAARGAIKLWRRRGLEGATGSATSSRSEHMYRYPECTDWSYVTQVARLPLARAHRERSC
jgi:hypothetical protein